MLQNLKDFSLPEIEKKALKFWKEDGIFEKSLALRQVQGKKHNKFVFFEGPPTANARPGIHHVLARAFKDIIPRYKTMAGWSVPRKGGWDTHGLPVELEVERELGLRSKKDIEKYGIAAFNKKCKESVWKYKDEWERLTERIGFWLDLKNPYITYENSYIESLWSILKIVWQKKLLYKGHKVVPWCTRCGTALSSHELALGYKEVEEESVYVKFKLRQGQKIGKNFKTDNETYILSWTTTPWTLPGNVALAVNSDVDYVKIKIQFGEVRPPVGRSNLQNVEYFILAKERLSIVNEPYEIIGEFKGKKLISLSYEPLFDVMPLQSPNSYKIYDANFVSTDEGTGIVHTAVMYGEDDYNLGKKESLPQYHTVDEVGKFTSDVPGLGSMYVKAKETEEKILEHLKTHNSLLKTEKYTHEYPFCWRCSTPLLYYARDSWFIGMSKLRQKLIAANKKINWIPTHIKEGRFGNWLKDVKDWAISRERYWGTPLPIWVCEKCGTKEAIGSIGELQSRTRGRNRYFFVRHGESDHNVTGTCGPHKDTPALTSYLTEKGKEQVRKTVLSLRGKNIDMIVASPLTRARETARIISEAVGKAVSYDDLLVDINPGIFYGRPVGEHHDFFKDDRDKFSVPPPEGESLNEAKKRMVKAFMRINENHAGKTIVIVGHADPLWLLKGALLGLTNDEILKLDYPKLGGLYQINTNTIPLDEEGNLDLHRPYIDRIELDCYKCGNTMNRIPEVADVWFDSGAMPFAQGHWPFEKKIDYPADYISEGVDQTRGWFYTLLAVGTLLGKDAPYKNVISLGLVLDKNGQKMSKSKGNTVDPWQMVEKYGADAVRWYFYTMNPPGEPKRFDEMELGKTFLRFFLLLFNSYVFLKTYGRKAPNVNPPAGGQASKNILDKWIIARLHETIGFMTAALEKYEIGESGRKIEEFVEDLSRWYIRRSRRRFQPERGERSSKGTDDHEDASRTLRYVLLALARLAAPFAPFFAEALYKSFGGYSVHLEDWPRVDKKLMDNDLLSAMKEAREVSSLLLAKRAEMGIKIRQPLRLAKIKNKILIGEKEILDLIKDEVNVKEIIVDPKIKEAVWLNTEVTHELREEGWLRDMVRMVQGLRQDGGFRPKDKLILMLESPEELRYVLQKHETQFKKEVSVVVLEYKRSEKFDIELETKFDGQPLWLALRKPL